MKTVFIIQARLGSTRLPGKILLPFFNGKSIIELLIDKLKNIYNTNVILATSTNTINDKLVAEVKDKVSVFRGSENDVLSRFIEAAKENNVHKIIRVCSDNPFLDIVGLEQLVNVASQTTADYVGFRINKKPSIQTHFGFWAEYVTLEALQKVYSLTQESIYHEHVTNYIYSNKDKFKIEWINAPVFIEGRNDIRLTIDTQEDFDTAKEIYKTLSETKPNFNLQDVVEYLDKKPNYLQLMKQQIIKNWK
ncbi:MAG: glycosyltransferase family protein [Bacteroidota bacterium]|nr:glycosyltransferase family protein [Bacteroidota bacterium]